MKHPKRTIILLLICVGGLVAVLLSLKFSPTKSSSSSESSTSATTLYHYQDRDLVSMTVKNAETTFTILPDAAATAKAASASAASGSSTSSAAAPKVVFLVKELQSLPPNTEAIAAAAENGYSLSSVKTIGASASLSAYGLEQPAATVTSKFKNGTSLTLFIGNQTPLDSTVRYVKLQNQDTVYAASVSEQLLKGLSSFVSLQVTNLSASSGNAASSNGNSANSVFSSITVQNTGKAPIALSRSGNNWIVNRRPADSERVASLTDALASVKATSVAALHPSSEQLKTYGLQNPISTVTYTAAGTTGTLLIGAQPPAAKASSDSESSASAVETGASYYVMAKGGRIVYLVSADSLPWLSSSAFDLQRLTVLENAKTDLASVTLQGVGGSYQIQISRTKNASASSDSVDYTYQTTCNGKKLTDEKTYDAFFAKAAFLQILEDSSASPTGKPAWTLRVQGYDPGVHHVYAFYPAGSRRYLVTEDGVACGLVSSSDVSNLAAAAKAMH